MLKTHGKFHNIYSCTLLLFLASHLVCATPGSLYVTCSHAISPNLARACCLASKLFSMEFPSAQGAVNVWAAIGQYGVLLRIPAFGPF